MTTVLQPSTTIHFGIPCWHDACSGFAEPLYKQLTTGRYDYPASLLQLPSLIEQWEMAHKTAAKRAADCVRRGYEFEEIDRTRYEDDVYAINTSTPRRQGRDMDPSYGERPKFSPLETDGCQFHRIFTYGVLQRGKLRAYAWVYRCMDLVLISQILGHVAHLEDNVMYLLMRGLLEDQINVGSGVAFYNRHDSGTDGLRFYKERCGFQPGRASWER